METITLKEAIEQGYKYYGFSDREWQQTYELHDDIFQEVGEDYWDDLVLFDKESEQPLITSKQIADLLSDSIGEQDSCESGREDDVVYEAVNSVSYTEIAKTVNDALKPCEYWKLTDIKIIR